MKINITYKNILVVLVCLILYIPVNAQNVLNENNLATKPLLGWNSYDSYNTHLDSKSALATIEVMAQKYLPFGYEYFVIDAGWYMDDEFLPGTFYPVKEKGPIIDQYGVYEASKAYFPEGLKVIADKAHQLGLKFGLHLMRGIPKKAVKLNLPIKSTPYRAADIADTLNICTWSTLAYGVDMTKSGAQEWYNSIFEKFASWGVDFVKVDDMTPYPLEIVAIAKAIRNCGRPMAYSLSPGDVNDRLHLPYYQKANMVRITRDIWDLKPDIDQAFDAWDKYQGYANKNFWPDLDMIPFGRLNVVIPERFAQKPLPENRFFNHQCRLSKVQMETFLTMRALAVSPLFIGGDLLNMDDFSYSLLTNKKMLACNQNGVMGTKVFQNDSIEVWHACDANQYGKGWIGIFNRSSLNKVQHYTRMELGLKRFFKSKQEIPMTGKFNVKDIWKDKHIDITDEGCSLTIPSDGVVFMEYEKLEQ